MDLLDNLLLGFSVALSWTNLFYCFMGVFLGTFIGVLPGIGALAAVSMLLPVTFYLDTTAAIVMLAGVYYGAEYGGSTCSILLNLPGTPSNAVTCLDGYPMAQQGRAGVALFTTTIACFVGGSVGIVILIFLSPVMVTFALSFRSTEYFLMMVFALVAAATIARGSPLKGFAMVLVGMLLGTVGMDISTGIPRYHLGFFELYEGISLITIAMGMFGISEVIASVNTAREGRKVERVSLASMIPTREDCRRSVMPMARGSAIGGVFGPLPGTGPNVAAFVSYAVEKRVARDPSRFGAGAIEGIASPEASNNAAAQTAFIPTLTFGIPGSATMAVMLGALMIHGIVPGPQLISDHPNLFWGLVASFWIGNLLLLILNIPLIGLWVRVLQIPYSLLYPVIIVLICIGIYSINSSVFDIGLVFLFGLVGYVMRLLEFEPAPLLIGFILGPMIEENFRRAMLLARGDFVVMLTSSTISMVLVAMTLALIAWTIWSLFRPRQRALVASETR